MPTYHYESLGDEEFQRLVAALVTNIHPGATAFAVSQADGGRDITHGMDVFQVKFVRSQGSRLNRPAWIRSVIANEEAKMRGLAKSGYRTYTIVTNISGTGLLHSGSIDTAAKIARERAKALGFKSIRIWWRDDLDARIAAAPDSLKRAFLNIVPTMDAVLLLRQSKEDDLYRTLRVFAANEFIRDSRVRFEQVDLHVPSVERLFVDVPVMTIRKIIPPGIPIPMGIEVDGDNIAVGGAHLLLDRGWLDDAVLVGGPGQGKTTLLQYVCQIARAAFLDKFDYLESTNTPEDKVVPRIAIKISLAEYAEWQTMRIAKENIVDESSFGSLEEYIALHISKSSGGAHFDVDNLLLAVSTYPTLLALDGLDEVADLNIRDEIAKQIAQTSERLHEISHQVVVLTATRPGIQSGTQHLPKRFRTLVVQRLSPALQLDYLDKWATEAGLLDSDHQRLRVMFAESLPMPYVAELASTPMQLAILLHLMQRRGILPEQRTELYRDYVQVFLDRESYKEEIVREYRPLVEDAHAKVAWHIQSSAEQLTTGNRLALDELRNLLADFVEEHGYPGELVQRLFASVTSRVICLVQRTAATVEFEVQPLREYFCARYLHDTAPLREGPGTKDERLAALLVRPYWLNVLRFFCGMLSRGEVRGLPSLLADLSRGPGAEIIPVARSLALQLLDDQVFLRIGSTHTEQIVGFALSGTGPIYIQDGLMQLPVPGDVHAPLTAGRLEVLRQVRTRLLVEKDVSMRSALAMVLRQNMPLQEILPWWLQAKSSAPSMPLWLGTAEDLGMLGEDSAEISEAIQDCFGAVEADLVIGALIRSGWRGSDTRVLESVAKGLGTNSLTVDPPDADPNLFSDVLNALHPGRFYEHLQGPAGMIKNRDRQDQIPTGLGETIEMLARHHAKIQPWHNLDGWLTGLALLAQVNGDTWLVRESATTIPPRLLPRKMSRANAIRLDAELAPLDVAHFYQQARAHQSTRWWENALSSTTNDLAHITWMHALLCLGSAPLVGRLLEGFGRTLLTSSSSTCRSLSLSLRRSRRLGNVRSLRLPPRTSLALSPYACAVLSIVCDAATAADLIERACSALSTWEDPSLLRDLMRRRGSLRMSPLPAKAFRDIRGFERSFSEEAALVLQHEPPSTSLARSIIVSPSRWPQSVVSAAEEVIGAQIRKTRPLSSIAADEAWFSNVT